MPHAETIEDFTDWYATPPGREAARLLSTAVRPLLGKGGRLLAVGQTAPVLTRLHGLRHERVAMIVETPVRWPATAASRSAVADPERLPFADALFDDALLVHALELCERPRAVLRELWRVLSPAGRVVLVVPNRAGIWARVEALPFGRGHPYGRGALTRLLDDAMFEVESWSTALSAPPVTRLRWLERPLARLAPHLGGVHVVAARKIDGLRPAGKVSAARFEEAMAS
ncbi:class I SAM-dependent methyltransferase [Glacieibacterium frigidum]|uniref:Class I SAM-dependent methyltransferase n=1 Tax=Glacieibacterium frigidum TaxID=2593303 RepID=A0A552UJ27_9SPHN|nr:class I SAM-dependent methyltransferase [Glacieibacterium frigidum]TRW18181.1 class I SAM-dependent methyltransferase [Glacieibacterium frigidum]